MMTKKLAKEFADYVNNCNSIDNKEILTLLTSTEQSIFKCAATGRYFCSFPFDSGKSELCNALSAFYLKRGFKTVIDLTHDDNSLLLTIMWGF